MPPLCQALCLLQIGRKIMDLSAVDGDFAADREIRYFIVNGLLSFCIYLNWS